jgi:hypothetical protein
MEKNDHFSGYKLDLIGDAEIGTAKNLLKNHPTYEQVVFKPEIPIIQQTYVIKYLN